MSDKKTVSNLNLKSFMGMKTHLQAISHISLEYIQICIVDDCGQ